MKDITIGQHTIGEGRPVFIIGEIGLNHNGSVKLAKELIDAAKNAGCDCVKLQKRHVEGLAIRSVLDAEDNRFPAFGKTYRQVREHIEFNADEYREIIQYAADRGILFLCTAFDIPSVEFLKALQVPAYKIASHSVTNLPLLRKLVEVGKPVIISSGMCHWEELDRGVNILKDGGIPVVLMHCVSSYPQALEESNLRMIAKLRERYDVPVGYSGHEIGHLPTVLSVAAGAVAVERHITLDTQMEGFDHKLSLDPVMLKDMVDDIRKAEQAMGTGEKRVSEREQITRDKYHVSIVSAVDIRAGEELKEAMVTFKNPGTGLPPSRLQEILNKKATQNIEEDVLLKPEMFE